MKNSIVKRKKRKIFEKKTRIIFAADAPQPCTLTPILFPFGRMHIFAINFTNATTKRGSWAHIPIKLITAVAFVTSIATRVYTHTSVRRNVFYICRIGTKFTMSMVRRINCVGCEIINVPFLSRLIYFVIKFCELFFHLN